MSRQRNAREALAQDQLTQAAAFGLQMQRQDLSERQFAAQIAQASYGLVKEQQTEDARVTLSQQLSAIDPLNPAARDQMREVQARYQGVLPASEFRNLVDPVTKQVEAYGGLVDEIRATTGVNPVIGEDGRYDLAATRQQASLIREEENKISRLTLDAVNRTFSNAPIATRVELGRNHELADQMINWALETGELSSADLFDDKHKFIYLTPPDTVAAPGIGTGVAASGGQLYNLNGVRGLTLKNGKTLAQQFKEAQDSVQAAERGAKMETGFDNNFKRLTEEAKLLQRQVYGTEQLPISFDANTADGPTLKAYNRLQEVNDLVAQYSRAAATSSNAASGAFGGQESLWQARQAATQDDIREVSKGDIDKLTDDLSPSQIRELHKGNPVSIIIGDTKRTYRQKPEEK